MVDATVFKFCEAVKVNAASEGANCKGWGSWLEVRDGDWGCKFAAEAEFAAGEAVPVEAGLPCRFGRPCWGGIVDWSAGEPPGRGLGA